MQKVYAREIGANGSVFTFYTYAMMLIPMLAVLLVCKKSGKAPSKVLFDRWHIYAFLLISAGLYVNSFTKVLAARLMPATQMYPTLQGANLIASATMASLLFKERITWRSALGILIAIAAVILMNMA
jgi:drug/metabolite transporter (DMT)-like permease